MSAPPVRIRRRINRHPARKNETRFPRDRVTSRLTSEERWIQLPKARTNHPGSYAVKIVRSSTRVETECAPGDGRRNRKCVHVAFRKLWPNDQLALNATVVSVKVSGKGVDLPIGVNTCCCCEAAEPAAAGLTTETGAHPLRSKRNASWKNVLSENRVLSSGLRVCSPFLHGIFLVVFAKREDHSRIRAADESQRVSCEQTQVVNICRAALTASGGRHDGAWRHDIPTSLHA